MTLMAHHPRNRQQRDARTMRQQELDAVFHAHKVKVGHLVRRLDESVKRRQVLHVGEAWALEIRGNQASCTGLSSGKHLPIPRRRG